MKSRRPEQIQRSQSDEDRYSSPAYCDSLLQNQQLSDHSQLSNANAIQKQNLDKPHKPSVSPQTGEVEQEFQSDSNEYKTYLVDYRYKGSTWSLELMATSWEDAEARVRCLINANVAGELALKIPVSESWLKRVQKWLNLF